MSVSSVNAYSSYSSYLNAKNGTTAAKTAETSTAAATTTETKTASAADTAVTKALSQIDSKLQMGSKLSQKEMSYLEQQDSDAYKEATKLQSERESYRKQLDGAKTKMDAESIRSEKMQALSDELKSVKNDSSLTTDQKTTQMSSIQKRQMAMVNETQSYTGTAKYNNLSLTTKADFKSMLESGGEESENIKNLLSYFGSSKNDASSFLSILNSTKNTSSLFGNGYYSSQLNAAQQLVNASYQAQNVQRESVIAQVLARESAKTAAASASAATSKTAVAQNTETAAKLNLTV